MESGFIRTVGSVLQNIAGSADVQDWEPTCSYTWNSKDLEDNVGAGSEAFTLTSRGQ